MGCQEKQGLLQLHHGLSVPFPLLKSVRFSSSWVHARFSISTIVPRAGCPAVPLSCIDPHSASTTCSSCPCPSHIPSWGNDGYLGSGLGEKSPPAQSLTTHSNRELPFQSLLPPPYLPTTGMCIPSNTDLPCFCLTSPSLGCASPQTQISPTSPPLGCISPPTQKEQKPENE